MTHPFTIASKPIPAIPRPRPGSPSFQRQLLFLWICAQLTLSAACQQILGISDLGSTPPATADAGPDQQVALGERVRLDASASTDADGDPLQYIWEAGQQNPSPVDLPSLASFEFSPAVAGTYTFVLKVDDSQALSAPDTVAVVVGGRRNTAPVANHCQYSMAASREVSRIACCNSGSAARRATDA